MYAWLYRCCAAWIETGAQSNDVGTLARSDKTDRARRHMRQHRCCSNLGNFQNQDFSFCHCASSMVMSQMTKLTARAVRAPTPAALQDSHRRMDKSRMAVHSQVGASKDAPYQSCTYMCPISVCMADTTCIPQLSKSSVSGRLASWQSTGGTARGRRRSTASQHPCRSVSSVAG